MAAVDTSMFAQVIQEHLELKRRNAALEHEMPLGRYLTDDPFENHPLFKTEEQARIEETMDGVEPDFSGASLEDVGVWPGEQQQQAAVVVDEPTADNAAPVAEESGFWNNGGAREFDWGE